MTAQYLTKHELAAMFKIKVSYVEAKTASREWPSLLIGGELRFGDEEIAEIKRLHRRDATPKTKTAAPAPQAAPRATARAAVRVTQLRARPVRRRGTA